MMGARRLSRARAAVAGGMIVLSFAWCSGAPAPAEAQGGTGPDSIRLNPALVDTGGPVMGRTSAPAGERWSLARIIAVALEQNVDSRAAHARTVQAKGAALGAWGGLLPSLTGDLDYTHTRQNSVTFLGVGDTLVPYVRKFDVHSAGLGAESNLLSVSALSEKRRRDHLRRSAQESEAEARNTVVFDVKQQYFNLLKAERLADVSAESERLARDEETRAQARFEVGTVARGDVLKAKARHATTRLDLIRAVNQVQIQRSRLKQIVGLRPGESLEIEGVLDERVTVPDSSSVVREALKARPQISSRAAAERAARSGLFGARMNRFPTITGSVNLDRSKNEERFKLAAGGVSESDIEFYSTDWRSNVRLTLPVFNGFALEGQMKTAKGQLLEAEAQRRQSELDVAVEVEQAWLTLREALERIDVAKDGLASAEEDYNFSKGRYELGAGTFLDMLNAEVGLAQAKQSYVEALADAHTAEAALERAVGARRY
jgi:outer membrane protein TolC